MIFLNQQERQERKTICDNCEKKNGVRCGMCGCFLIAMQKVKFTNCPLGKWKIEEQQN
jgi:hypothetical protein